MSDSTRKTNTGKESKVDKPRRVKNFERLEVHIVETVYDWGE